MKMMLEESLLLILFPLDHGLPRPENALEYGLIQKVVVSDYLYLL